MNKLKSILFSLVIAVFLVVACKTTMSQVQEDLSKKLTEYTVCPQPPIFEKPLIETQNTVTMDIKDFNSLDHYVLQLEVCSSKRLLDIVYRNRIIQDLLRK